MCARNYASPWPVVGWDRELRALCTAWADPQCTGLVIFGPTGVGKSRLAEECVAHATRAGFSAGQATAWAGRCAGARSPLVASAALTTREREIALLAAAGRSSKEIAETPHLSVRTVANRLQHAHTKLEVGNRQELAVRLGHAPSSSGDG